MWRRIWYKIRYPKVSVSLYLSQRLIGVLVLFASISAITQGLDYIGRPPYSTAWQLTVLEQKMPLGFWATFFLLFGFIALIGFLLRIWPLAILGHGVLSATYITFGIGVWWSVVDNWRGFGWQIGVLWFCIGVFNFFIADSCYDEWSREWKAPPPRIAKSDNRIGDD